MTLDEKYPNIANWIADGCIEIGSCDDGYTDVTARAYDEGGTVWETTKRIRTLDAMMDALEAGIADWCAENGNEWET